MEPKTTATKGARSVDEISAWSGLSQVYIRRAIKNGKLAAVRAGRRVLILEESAQAFLASLPKAC